MKQIFHKVGAVFMAFLFILLLSPYPVFAESALQSKTTETIRVSETAQSAYSKEMCEALYIENLFYEDLFPSISLYADHSAKLLTSTQYQLYRDLKVLFQNLADNGGLASYTIPEKHIFLKEITGTVINEVSDKLRAELHTVINCLLNDIPQNCYWMMKTNDYQWNFSYYTDGNGNFLRLADVTLTFGVDTAYAAPSHKNTVDTAKIQRARQAKENAVAIAQEFKQYSRFEKEQLRCIKNKICELTDYDHNAVGNTSAATTDPWQLVNVFDGDPNTKVVCAGYAKAFQYLCELIFTEGGPECYCVTGTMNGGNHMWNLVCIAGQSYLVDVTNCDARSVGGGITSDAQYIPGDGLFMRYFGDGLIEKTSQNSYTVKTPDVYAGNYILPGSSVTYQYDKDSIQLYGNLLRLETTTPTYSLGDFNGDGKTMLNDYNDFFVEVVSGTYWESAPEDIFLRNDINRDGNLDVFDVSLLNLLLHNQYTP